jgi:hypothetical protein
MVVLALDTGGCTSSHSGSDLSKLDTFTITKNVTTEQQLVSEFGTPASIVTQSDGTTLETWADGRTSQSDPIGSALIPNFSGNQGISVKMRSLAATIRDGVVVDYTISNGSQHY